MGNGLKTPWGTVHWSDVTGLFGGATKDKTADQQRQNMNNQGGMSSVFADQAQQGYNQLGQESQQVRDYLRGVASGQNSIAAEQLRQGLQQNMAAQRSMAASAAPNNQAMAARTAAMNMGRMGAGMSGQAALAGLQERRDAQSQLGQMILGQRGQDAQVAVGSRGNAISAYGGFKPEGSWLDKWANPIAGGIAAGAKLSDKRTKTDINDGNKDANAAIEGLRAYKYKYKDPANGKDSELGIMAQDLEKSGLKHTVMETPKGKMINGAALATANTAMISALGARLKKLESK